MERNILWKFTSSGRIGITFDSGFKYYEVVGEPSGSLLPLSLGNPGKV